jgi:hypothetical protein
MNAEVTGTSAPGFQLPALQLKTTSVSAFDPDRDMAQQQFSSSTRFPEPQHRRHKVRPRMEMSLWGGFGQVGQIRQPAGLRVSNFGRDATIIVCDILDSIVYVSPHTSTGYSTAPDLRIESDPWSEYIAGIEEKESDAQQVRQAYKARIDMLRIAAAPEGIELNGASVRDFWSFIKSSHFSRRAGLALMDNGNIRAVWKGEDSSHLGLHFLGSRQVQYVIFKRRPGSRRISRTAGIDTFEGVKKQIGAFDLMPLVKA